MAPLSGGGTGTPQFPTPSISSANAIATAETQLPEAHRTFAGTAREGRVSRRSKATPWIIVAAVSAFAGGGIAIFAFKSKAPTSSSEVNIINITTGTAPSAPAPSASATTPEPAVSVVSDPKDVALHIVTRPPNADIYVGDKRLGRSKEKLRLPFGREPVRLTIKSKQYIPGTLDVTPDHDIEDEITLKAAKPNELVF
jgi:hypothetical protein